MIDDLESILSYCVADGRVCPQPKIWDQLWKLLPERRRTLGRWEPMPPLILGGWHASDGEKRDRLAHHIKWAFDRDAFRTVDMFLRALPKDQLHHERSPEEASRLSRYRQHRREISRERSAIEAENALQWNRHVADHLARKPAIDARYHTSLDQSLIAAYRATDYQVSVSPPFTLNIGCRSDELAAWFEQMGMTSAAYITAWNPCGASTCSETNIAASERLKADITADGYPFIEGEGRGTIGDWPPEPSILIFGMSRSKAKQLGKRYRQNAVLWIGVDAVPSLIVLMKPSNIGFGRAT